MKFSEAINKYHHDDATKYTGGMFSDPQTGGSLIPIENLEPSVALLINEMTPGEFSKPFEYTDEKTGDRLVRIVYLKKRTEPHKANLEEDYSKIQQAAFSEKQTTYLMKWLEGRIPSFYIKVGEEYNDCTMISKWNNNAAKK
jgi:peptidyl-prolyl cis-trans isomerase SurA